MLICGDGFDHYPTANLLQKWDGLSGGTAVQTISTLYGRLGSQGILTYGAGNYNLVKNLPAANASLGFVGAAVYVPNYSTLRRVLFGFQDVGGSVINNSQVLICLENDGSFSIRSSYSGGTLIATTAPGKVTAGTWHYIEAKVKVHNSLGSVEIRVDEQVVYTGTNLNTRQQTSNNYFTRVTLGGSDGSAPTWETTYFDDWYYCDDTGARNNSYLGDVTLGAIYPKGAGSSTMWSIGGSVPAATNWQSVNEHTPNDDVTLVKSAVVNDLDLYTMDATPATAAAIKGLLFNVRVKKDDATARTYSTMAKDVAGGGSAGAVATRATPFGAYTNQQDVSELTPEGVAWTKAKVDAMEAGIKVIS